MITRYANATAISLPLTTLTIYKRARGPLFSIELYSHSSGTTLMLDLFNRQISVNMRCFAAANGWNSHISARRYYRKGN